MKKHILQLARMAERPSRTIIGLMSGTSFDGLDIALCTVSGTDRNTQVNVEKFETIPYDESFRSELKKVFSKKDARLEDVCLLNPYIAVQHAAMINDCLQRWKVNKADVDLIASHGQTIFHAPRSLHGYDQYGNATLQIGDGDHLAVLTGIITVSDFRQKHIAAGGEGAPLAVYGDYFLFSGTGDNRILLNIGGISNFTFLPAGDKGKMFSSDVGPGNTLMDAAVRKYYNGEHYDHEAVHAINGTVNADLLTELKSHPFFCSGFPKTTGPELFNLAYVENAAKKVNAGTISPDDLLATLNRLTADTVIDAIRSAVNEPCSIFVSGGGMHNPLLMQSIREGLPGYNIDTTSSLSIDPDAKEAVLFAILANECIAGEKFETGGDSSGMPVPSMGKISLPE